MGSNSSPPNPARLLQDLQTNPELKHQPIIAAGLDPHLALLRTWQSERLKQTYADLLTDKGYQAACLFFLSDLYAPRDFSQRDHDAERIHAFLTSKVPARMLQLLTDVIALNKMTDELDKQLMRVLVDQLGVANTITPTQYAEGYRRCDNSVERAHQIGLTIKIVLQVGEGARLKVVGLALKVLRRPAHSAGWTEVYDFLEAGYSAFRQIQDVKLFANTIEQREKRILDQIFAGSPDPFAVDGIARQG